MTWSRALVAKAFVVGVVALAVGAGLGYAVSHERPPATPKLVLPAPPAGAAELALIAPLEVGAVVDGFQLRAVDAVKDGAITLTLVRDRAIVRVQIALDSPHAPAVAGRYAVFYSLADANATEGEGQKLAKTIAARLVLDAPTPPGLTVRQERR